MDATVRVVLPRANDSESNLPKALRPRSRIPVEAARDGTDMQSGACYVGEASRILYIGGDLRLRDGAGNRFRGRTVDVLSRSMATLFGDHAIGMFSQVHLATAPSPLPIFTPRARPRLSYRLMEKPRHAAKSHGI